MGIAELLATYMAGRITEETFRKLLKLSQESDLVSDTIDSLEELKDDFFDFFSPFLIGFRRAI